VSNDRLEAEAIARRVRDVIDRIEQAARRVGRPSSAIRLVAATKSVSVERIQAALQAGIRIIGENRLQEALGKMEGVTVVQPPVSWHFIGRLQRRKVRQVVGRFQLIHSVDGVELAREIELRAAAAGIRQAVLLEINIGAEATKTGFAPSCLIGAAAELDALTHVQVQGLMAIPPATDDPEQSRPYFRQVRALARQLADRKLANIRMVELSMGMSQDFEVAIEEGATLVRIGTALFGARQIA
jgi:pyridoxal phosphate enzyme (YggS family)